MSASRPLNRRLLVGCIAALAMMGWAHAQPAVLDVGANSAGLTIRLASAGPVRAGASLQFVLTARRKGYLILLGVEPSGEVRQIFPALPGDILPFGANDETNALRPGKPMTIPDMSNVLGNFELFAAGPGKAAVIALLSPVPVQVIGLTELPASTGDVTAAVKAVLELVKDLLVLPRSERAKMGTLSWSSQALIYDVE